MHIRTVITFDQIKKLDAKGNFDLSATLGEFVKLTYNNYPSETLQNGAKIWMRGNLRVELNLNEHSFIGGSSAWIVSDDKSDYIPLRWLSPWLGEVSLPTQRLSKVVMYDMLKFERQFILPFLTELTEQLAGQNPLEYLMLKQSQRYLKRHEDIHPFNADLPLSFDEKTGHVQLALRDGTKVDGMKQCRRYNYADHRGIRFDKEFKQPVVLERCKKRVLKTEVHEGSFIKTAIADIVKCLISEAERKSNESATSQEKNYHTLYCLVASYRMDRINGNPVCLIEPFRKAIVNHIIHVVLPAMTIEELVAVRLPPGPAQRYGFRFYVGPTHLHNLIALGDHDILKGVLDRLKKEKMDVNKLSQLPFLMSYYSRLGADLSQIERRELLRLLFAAGMKVIPEELEKGFIDHDGKWFPIHEEMLQESLGVQRAMQESVKPAELIIKPAVELKPVDSHVALTGMAKLYEYVLKKGGIEKLFVEEGLDCEDKITACSDEAVYQINFLRWMFSYYGRVFDSDMNASQWENVRKAIVHQIVHCLLPSLRAHDLPKDLVCTGLNFPSRDIFDALIRKMRKADIDLNVYFSRHPLFWFSREQSRMRTIRRSEVAERQWMIQRLFDEDVEVTSELLQQLTDRQFSQENIELILSELYLHYKRIFVSVFTLLSRDTTGIVMRYLMCEEVVNKDVKQLPVSVVPASQNRNSFLTTMTEAGSSGDSPGADSLNSRATPRATHS